MRLGWWKGSLASGLVAMIALLLAGVAAADKEKVQLTPAGQAAARAAVLTRADLGAVSGWTGGAQKPDLTSTPPCASFRPKQSDLVLIGAAKTVWQHTGLRFESVAQVLQTAAMVRLDWQRTVLAPQMLPCLRSGLAKQLGSGAKLVSFGPVGVPKIATYTRRYRALVDVTTATATVRVMVDVLVVGRGRTEITLITTAPSVAAAVVEAAELRLARTLASRATA